MTDRKNAADTLRRRRTAPGKKAALLLLTVLCAVFLLTGCRARTFGREPSLLTAEGEAAPPRENARQDPAQTGEEDARDGAEDDGAGSAVEDPAAVRMEFDENAPAEVVPGLDRLLHAQGEGPGLPGSGDDPEGTVTRVSPQAEEPAVQTVPAADAERLGVSEDAQQADSALTYFTVLLQDRGASLFECQRLTVYWETKADHVTVHKSSPEHELILSAGAYDVSARLLPENLRVDDGWIARKNPGVIVKVVDRSVLGSAAVSVQGARAVRRELVSRPGLSGADAVKNGRIVLLSEEMLEAPQLRVAAAVVIAAAANPALYADVDLAQMLSLLMREAPGSAPEGIFYYSDRED